MNVAKKRYTPYDIARNICGVKRAMINANSLAPLESCFILRKKHKRTN